MASLSNSGSSIVLPCPATAALYEAATSVRFDSDLNLIRRAQQGDSDAFASLFYTHKAKIYSVCLRMTNNTAEAEDLTQDAFLQVFRKLVVPHCLPWIISVLRVNIGLALTGAIVGEFIASQHGLGRQILYAGNTYDIALVWVAVLVLSTLAVIMYAAVSWLERILRKGIRQ